MKRKIKRWIKKTKEFFRGKTVTVMAPNPGGMKMLTIGAHDADDLFDVLGVPADRARELHNIFIDQLKKDKATKDRTCMDSVIAVSEHCKHQNELGLIAFIGGRLCEKICGSGNEPITIIVRSTSEQGEE